MNNTFTEIDEALYQHERPYYHACAGGAHFTITPEWERERIRLINLWHKHSPYEVNVEPKKSWVEKIKAWLKSII